MKRLIFVCVVLLVIGCASVFAQRGGGAGGGGGTGNRGMGGGGMGPGGGNRPGMESGQNRGDNQRRDGAGNRQDGAQNDRQQQRAGRALRGLGLSDEQRQQIRDIERTARENGTDPQTVRDQIRGVLTPEQLDRLENRKEKNKNRRGNQQTPPPTGGTNP